VGRPVADETVVSILGQEVARPLLAAERRFCANPSCGVLYYGPDGISVTKDSARVRVGVKETEDPIPLCYCFGFTRAEVRREVEETGDSTLPARIAELIRVQGCTCRARNPAGHCCLGEVEATVAREKAGAAHLASRMGPGVH